MEGCTRLTLFLPYLARQTEKNSLEVPFRGTRVYADLRGRGRSLCVKRFGASRGVVIRPRTEHVSIYYAHITNGFDHPADAPGWPASQVIGVYKGKEFDFCSELDSVTFLKTAERS